jgi:hypothetical protein
MMESALIRILVYALLSIFSMIVLYMVMTVIEWWLT